MKQDKAIPEPIPLKSRRDMYLKKLLSITIPTRKQRACENRNIENLSRVWWV